MKKSILLLAVLSVFAFSSCKDNAADKVNEENVAAAADRDAESGKFPKITFEESQYDFGTIDKGTHVEHLFKFKNTGDAPLMIVNAKSSCGCTVPEWTKDPIAPGGEGELLVKFDGSGQNQVSKTITLTTNTEAGTESLVIKAFVNPTNPTTKAPTS
ncbi:MULTISPECIES: DUF1573 domain-containing protein [Flavobacteriales]|uniref:DUF1573 domain-containing protein n=1 Tax=Aequorivita viscosa TaxID=797419 RepID=A0A1M6J6G2_9FLAO|nr:DUF1573 domain-containing protein [Aequorivita viscosa]SDX06832.1 Protein of unknown function [Aequorivita viscosa]SHJ42260.1 Protein of unknown function [Aequorivita viscosa]